MILFFRPPLSLLKRNGNRPEKLTPFKNAGQQSSAASPESPKIPHYRPQLLQTQYPLRQHIPLPPYLGNIESADFISYVPIL